MKRLSMSLIAFGCLGLFAFYMGAIKGEIKWNPDKILTGTQARLVGVVGLIVGLVMIGVGGYLALRAFGVE